LQEHILSGRVIQYTTEEVYWACRTGRASETRPTLVQSSRFEGGKTFDLEPACLPERKTLDAATQRQLLALWSDIVSGYSKRKLPRESDKLYAISGIAEAFQVSDMGRYFAGAFEAGLLPCLAWQSASHFPEGEWEPTHVRPTSYRGPTWSWASIEGEVHWLSKQSDGPLFNDDYLRQPLAQCHVVRISDTELVSRGKVVTGVLKKNTACLPTEDCGNSKTGTTTSRSYECGNSEIIFGSKTYSGPYTDIIDTTPMHPGVDPPRGLMNLPLNVICLMLGEQLPNTVTHFATALVFTRSARAVDVYKRVGIDYSLDVKHFKGVRRWKLPLFNADREE
jgi:hypothetical protein